MAELLIIVDPPPSPRLNVQICFVVKRQWEYYNIIEDCTKILSYRQTIRITFFHFTDYERRGPQFCISKIYIYLLGSEFKN